MAGVTSPPGRVTQGSFFEALFVRALKADGAFEDALRAVGFDKRRPEARYPIEVWNRALEVAWKQRYSHLSRDAAYRELGRQWVIGFSQTIVGRVVSVALPTLGPKRFLARVPQYTQIDSYEYEVRIEEKASQHYIISFRNDPDAKPEFMAGLIEEGLRKTGTIARVEATARTPRDFDLEIRW